ncbi:uncharacterized protein LOC129926647 [Biomphalaria glabrata]|uniref:Uncharacterized protein LOC129926647 n=1 Tax=Biomphalaria glabrata TaxID=6526 RepID=A0A9W3ALD5_BIOGL|nr:uncharacterized protein LOC129926647 [Biomphalaria glabrata]
MPTSAIHRYVYIYFEHLHRTKMQSTLKDILYGDLIEGRRAAGRPLLWYTDVCKRDMKLFKIDTGNWEEVALDRSTWRESIKEGSQIADVIHNRSRKKGENAAAPSDYICPTCDRSCVSRIGLFSHT